MREVPFKESDRSFHSFGAGAELEKGTNIWVTNAAVIGLWIVSRTSGVPIGPKPWMREMVGYTDTICAGFEVLAVVLALALVAPEVGRGLASRLRPATAGAVALGVAPLTLVALRFAGMA